MKRYYPDWSQRYPALLASYESYTATPTLLTSKFNWNLDETGVMDPEGYANMTAEEILEDMFRETVRLYGQDMVEKADQIGIISGKLNLIYKLMDAAQGQAKINIMDWIDSSVQEIQEAIKSY